MEGVHIDEPVMETRSAPTLVPNEAGGESDASKVDRRWDGLTARSVVVGSLIGTVTTVENIYFALKYGWTVTNNISAAILGWAALRAWTRLCPSAAPFTPQENCVLMTSAVSATAMVWGGSMPFAILAMGREIRDAVGLEGDTEAYSPSLSALLTYSASLCFIGFALAIPLRRKFVVDEPLPFPYAIAAAKTIESLHAGDGAGDARFLGLVLLPAMCWAMLAWCVAGLEQLALFGLAPKRRFKWQLNLSVAPCGHGFIVPTRFVLSEVAGAALASGLLIPLAVRHRGDWYSKTASGFEGAEAYYYMPAILAVAATSSYQMLKMACVGAFRARASVVARVSDADTLGDALLPGQHADSSRRGASDDATQRADDRDFRVPVWAWSGAWFACSLLALLAFTQLFHVRVDMALVALLSAPLWSVGITMAVGTTGSNVASSCGKVMIMLFAAWYGSPHIVAVLALGALAIAVIDQALDLVRDFKTAELVGASPSAMFAAQSLGAGLSILTSSVLYHLYVSHVPLPSANLPAVIAKSYRGLAFAFAGGLGTLPKHCLELSKYTALVATLFDMVHDLLPANRRCYCPSGIAFGVGIILLSGQCLMTLLGWVAVTLWHRIDPGSAAKRAQLFGAALLAGDGLAGVLQSLLEVGGVDPPFTFTYPAWWW